MSDHRQASDRLSAEDAALIKLLLQLGHAQKRIAALFDCNQGRISEINRGQTHGTVRPLKLAE